MNKIKFEELIDVYVTDCPYRIGGVKVGSPDCVSCDMFVADNRSTEIVCCDALHICPGCGKEYETIEKMTECKEICLCKHDWKYFLYSIDDPEIEVERKCNLCGRFEEKCIYSSDISSNQGTLKALWNT